MIIAWSPKNVIDCAHFKDMSCILIVWQFSILTNPRYFLQSLKGSCLDISLPIKFKAYKLTISKLISQPAYQERYDEILTDQDTLDHLS